MSAYLQTNSRSLQEPLRYEKTYITEVLGLKVPLHESYPYSESFHRQILHEQLILEGFFDGLKKLKDDALLFGKSLKEIITNPDKIGSFIIALNKMVLKKLIRPIRSFFTMVKEKLEALPGDTFQMFVKVADSILSGLDKVLEKVNGLSGWKKAIGVMGLSLGIKYIYDKVGELIEEGQEKLEELIPMIDVIETAGLAEDDGDGAKIEKAKEALKQFATWFKDNIIGQVVDFVKEKLAGVAKQVLGSALTGVKAVWDTLTSLYGGAKFVMGTLSPALERFTFKIDENLLREYVRELLAEGSRIVPTSMSMSEWEAYKKKHKTTAKAYNKKSGTKWKITHGPGHKNAGKTIKGNTGLTYKKAKSIQNAFGGW